LRKYSHWIGTYPYETASLVAGDDNDNSSGMEYPTIALITTQSDEENLDATIVHELGHNWFYAAFTNNERQYPWMDESINSYYQKIRRRKIFSC
jgi:hypothetical protein